MLNNNMTKAYKIGIYGEHYNDCRLVELPQMPRC